MLPTSWLFGLGWLLFASVPNLQAQEDSLDYWNGRIDLLAQQKDTAGVWMAFSEAHAYLRRSGRASSDPGYLNFSIKETRYASRYSKITVDSALVNYQTIYEAAKKTQQFTVLAKVLGRQANGFRSKGQLGRAFQLNQEEIQAARQSEDPELLCSSLITELDIAYNSMPWPVEKEDLQPLVEKANAAISYAREHQLERALAFGKLYISKFYIKQEEFDKAEEILLSISDENPLNITFTKYEHLCEMAKLTHQQRKYREYTLAFKKRAYATKRTFVALNAHNYLLDYWLVLGDADSTAYYAGQLEENLKQVDTTKYLDYLDVSYATLANYFNKVDVSKELQYVSYSGKINRILSNRRREAFTEVLKYKEEVSALEAENLDLESANTWFRNNLLLLAIILMATLSLALILYKRYRRSVAEVVEVASEKRRIEETVLRDHIELNNKQRIYLEDLKFLKADRNYVEFHTTQKRIVDRNKLSAILENLPPNFVQVHRSYAINKNFIKTTSGSHLILVPDIEIPLSRTFKAQLKSSL